MARKRIFVSAYACEPGLGSEIGVGWHWVLEMSKYFDLWVLTRRSNMPNINAWLAENPDFSNINFIYYDLPKWARFWKKGLRGVRLYYILWQLCSNNIVKRTMIENNISIFHHLTYGNALWNVSRYGSKQTFIWGPVGGLETIPENFSRHYDTKCRIIEKFRRFAVAWLKEKWNIPSRVKAAVLSHHENEDGSGYPNGLTGDNIHMFAKIIHVADVYDALSNERAYKKAYSYSESLEYLMGGCGTLFDQTVVQAFMDKVPVYPKGVSIILSDGREAIVVENHLGNPLRPTVRFLDGTEMDMSDSSAGINITIINQADTKTIDEQEMVEFEEERKSRELKSILVVDDMVTSIRSVKSALDGLYKIIAVRSGEEALQYLKKSRPHLILMDILMPNMDGIETVKRIRQQIPGNIPVIFLSSASDVQTVLACRDIHADDYIVKPFKVDYIKQRIAMVLGEL